MSGKPVQIAVRVPLAAVLALAVLAPIPAKAAKRERPSIEKVGELPILYPKGFQVSDVRRTTLILAPARRRAYQLFNLSDPPRTAIRSFDLDTLHPLGPGRIGTPGYAEIPRMTVQFSQGGSFVHALEEENGTRLFLVSGSTSASPSEITRVDLARVDEGRAPFHHGVPLRQFIPAVVVPAGDDSVFVRDSSLYPIRTISTFKSPQNGGQKLLLGSYVVPAPGTSDNPTSRHIEQWNGDTLAFEWEFEIDKRACPWIGTSGDAPTQPPLWRSGVSPLIYVLCGANDKAHPQLVSVALDASGRPVAGSERVIRGPGDGRTGAAIPDPAADRVTVVTLAAPKGKTFWTFDGPEQALAGTAGFRPQHVGDDSNNAFGIDQTTGRVYALAGDYETCEICENKLQARRGGLFLLDSRLTPIPQAIAFPELSYPSVTRIEVDPEAPGRERRIFLRRAGTAETCIHYPDPHPQGPGLRGSGCPQEHYWTVYAERVPIPRQPTLADLDANTQGVTEQTDRTERTFEGSGGAYGMRVRMLGGLRAALTPGITGNDDIDDFAHHRVLHNDGSWPIFDENPQTHHPFFQQSGRTPESACWTPDREALTAHIEDAVVTEHEASAVARPIEADSGTQVDQSAPASRCRSLITPYEVPGPNTPQVVSSPGVDPQNVDPQKVDINGDVVDAYAAADDHLGSEWKLQDAACSGDGTEAVKADEVRDVRIEDDNTQSVGAGEHPGIYATVTCALAESSSGQARANAVQAGEVIIGGSSTDVAVQRLPDGGLRATSIAEARGIVLEGISIDLVRTTAISEAAGRTGTAKTFFTREVCGVNLGGEQSSKCYRQVLTPGCDLQVPEAPEGAPEQMRSQRDQLAREQQERCEDSLTWLLGKLNALLTGRAQFFLRTPEPPLAQGTPGGYLAGIQKREIEVVNDSLILRDFTREVPGLEFTTYRDSANYGTGRQIIQLAGVRATTSYGTFCVSPFEPQAGACVPGAFDEGLTPVIPPQSDPSIDPGPAGGGGSRGGVVDDAPPPPPPAAEVSGPVARARAFLVRSFREGLLGAGVWFFAGLPLYLASRRMSLRRAFPSS